MRMNASEPFRRKLTGKHGNCRETVKNPMFLTKVPTKDRWNVIQGTVQKYSASGKQRSHVPLVGIHLNERSSEINDLAFFIVCLSTYFLSRRLLLYNFYCV